MDIDKFERCLDDNGLKYDSFYDPSGVKRYFLTFDSPKHNLVDVGISFGLDGQSAPEMTGFNFFKSSDYEMNRLVDGFNKRNEENNGKDFLFYVSNTGDGNEVLVEFGTRTNTVILVNNKTIYDYYIEATGQMIEYMFSFRQYALSR